MLAFHCEVIEVESLNILATKNVFLPLGEKDPAFVETV